MLLDHCKCRSRACCMNCAILRATAGCAMYSSWLLFISKPQCRTPRASRTLLFLIPPSVFSFSSSLSMMNRFLSYLNSVLSLLLTSRTYIPLGCHGTLMILLSMKLNRHQHKTDILLTTTQRGLRSQFRPLLPRPLLLLRQQHAQGPCRSARHSQTPFRSRWHSA